MKLYNPSNYLDVEAILSTALERQSEGGIFYTMRNYGETVKFIQRVGEYRKALQQLDARGHSDGRPGASRYDMVMITRPCGCHQGCVFRKKDGPEGTCTPTIHIGFRNVIRGTITDVAGKRLDVHVPETFHHSELTSAPDALVETAVELRKKLAAKMKGEIIDG